jgi:hypothetical protein
LTDYQGSALKALELKRPQRRIGNAMAQVQNYDAYEAALGIEVQYDSWLDLLRLGYRLFVDANTERPPQNRLLASFCPSNLARVAHKDLSPALFRDLKKHRGAPNFGLR